MPGCNSCGTPYNDSFPDWTICRSCMMDQIPVDSYVDALGIVWSQEEMAGVGGIEEVDKMVYEADVRNKK